MILITNTIELNYNLYRPFRNQTFYINPVTSLIKCILEKGLQLSTTISGDELLGILNLKGMNINQIVTSNPILNDKLQKNMVKIAIMVKSIDKLSDKQIRVWDKIAKNVLETKKLFEREGIRNVVNNICLDNCSVNIKEDIISGIKTSIDLIQEDSIVTFIQINI